MWRQILIHVLDAMYIASTLYTNPNKAPYISDQTINMGYIVEQI